MNMEASGFISDLPVLHFRESIVQAVDTHQVTIITAETGAGKSTQVPQYLADHGYTKVIITQPRILAARNLAQRVREEWALRTLTDSDTLIGYRTAHERDDSPETQILYCTDGLQLVREITGAGVKERQVLVLDEVHEWNENMEVLVAWAKKRCQEDAQFKVVIMSATIETDALAGFYGDAAVINIPGRSFEVKKRRGTNVFQEIIDTLQTPAQSNILVFLPGKAEIQDTTDAIKKYAQAANVPVIPLHSQLESTAQQAAFAHYPTGKIILATNIAQTSVTIDDIDIVIDSGLERRSEVRNGVEGLFIAQISQADSLQRAGRAGRTKPGEYILAAYDTLPCLDFDDRPPYATPEILRKHIDRLTLRLANIGLDIEELNFYHEPSRKAIQRAKRTLIALGALTSSGKVTSIGRAMERYPVESSYARMLVEASSAPSNVQSKLAAIIAIQEVGGIVKGGPRTVGWQAYTRQTASDLLAQYDVFLALPTILPEQYEELGIIAKNTIKAREVMQRLDHDLQDIQMNDTLLTPISDEEQSLLLRCIVAGQIDQLWTVNDAGIATHITTKTEREISSSTVVRHPRLVSGTPFDLQVPTHDGSLQTLHLVHGITTVKTEWLVDLAPERFVNQRGRMAYDPRSGSLVIRQQVRIGKQILEGADILVTQNSKVNQRAFQDAITRWIYDQIERERVALLRFHTKRIPAIPLAHITQQVKTIADGVITIEDLSSEKRRQLMSLLKLATHLGDDFMNRIAATHRSMHSPGRHHAHRGWKPAHKRVDKRKSWR